MREESGLADLIEGQTKQITAKVLSALLLDDLKNGCCEIFGKAEGESPVLLATLNVLPDTLIYERFDQRLEFIASGVIKNDQYVPLTYNVKGEKFQFYGRCSIIPKVCGVDLYLSQCYTANAGDVVQQRLTVSVKKLLKICKKIHSY